MTHALHVHEEFLGLYSIPNIQSSMIVSAVQDTLSRINLPITKALGQCYDGAYNMSGVRNGVATQLQEL